MNKGESTRRMLDGISKRNMELDGRADYHKGLRMERKRITEIIKSHIASTYPINCEAIIKEINGDAILGDKE